MTRVSACVMLCVVCLVIGVSDVTAEPTGVVEQEWRFDDGTQWGSWHPNGEILDARFESDCVAFRTVGADPFIVGPLFEWGPATNGQRVEIEIDCDGPGEGEFFFTNTVEGPHGGFKQEWHVPFVVPAAGRQVVYVWPFWERLGQIARVRFDPPSGLRCRLYSIRIVSDEPSWVAPRWSFDRTASSWQPMYAAQMTLSPEGLRVLATRPMALLTAPVEPFEAATRSMLTLDVDCPGEHTLSFYWANREEPGLWGEPLELPTDGGPIAIDLRRYPEWDGTITNLAIGFGSHGGETLTLRSLWIEDNDPEATLLRVVYFWYATGVGRPGRPTHVRAIVEHAAGPPLPADQTVMTTDAHATCTDTGGQAASGTPRQDDSHRPGRATAASPETILPVPALAAGERVELDFTIVPHAPGPMRIELSIGDQTFTRTLHVDPPVDDIVQDDYEVPKPRPVATDYQIGVYYYPGWWHEDMRNWKRQAELPERDPLLGWYEEGRPEVADWHIKWAVENGISFFVYDWYWREGQEPCPIHNKPALDEGFLNARYNEMLQFAVMWANHKPFSSHTLEQLLRVTDYWLEHYLRRPNYFTVDGVPYVSFYSPRELLNDLGSPEAIRAAFEAMRQRVREAGLPGLHIAAIDIAGQVRPEVLKESGFDSWTAYTYSFTRPHIVSHSLFRSYLLGYRDKWEEAQQADQLPYVPVLGVGWDGPIWYGPRSHRHRGRRVEDVEEALVQLKDFLDETGGRMALLEAWNEWGEGSYIEPNVEFGFGDLEAIRRVFARPGDWPVNIGPEDVGLIGRYDQRRGMSRNADASD